MTTPIQKEVAEFHRVFDVPTRKTPTIPPDSEVRYRLRFIVEEFFEILAASRDGNWAEHLNRHRDAILNEIDALSLEVDLPKFIDGLGDLNYVVEGAFQAFGVNSEIVGSVIHRANMTKSSPCANCGGYGVTQILGEGCRNCRGTGRIVKKRADGKVEKPSSFQPPDIEGELVRQGWRPNAPSQRRNAVYEPSLAEVKLNAIRHALRDAETHGFDAGSIIRLLEAAK